MRIQQVHLVAINLKPFLSLSPSLFFFFFFCCCCCCCCCCSTLEQVQSELQKVWLRRKRGRLDSATLPRTHWQTMMTSSIMRHCSSLRLMNSTSINEKRASQTFRLQNKQFPQSSNRDPKQIPSIPKNLLNTNGKATVTKITPTASASKLTTFPIVTTTIIRTKTAEKKHSHESPVWDRLFLICQKAK